MTELPHPWGAYARLQARSSRTSNIDSFSWGIEEEMSLFLENPLTYATPDERRAKRIRATAARRERERAALRHEYADDIAPTPRNPILQFEAREALAQIESATTAAQWALLLAGAVGHDYADISRKHRIGISAARTQICRLRQQFLHLRPAA